MDVFSIVVVICLLIAIGASAAGFLGVLQKSIASRAALIAALLLTTVLAIIYSQQILPDHFDLFGIAPIALFGLDLNIKLIIAVLVILFGLAGWLSIAEIQQQMISGQLNSTALALIPLTIAINIAVGQIVQTIKLPLYLDSIGTVLAGALLGPWIGLLTGALSNVIWTLSGLPNSGPAIAFSYVAAVIGALAGWAGRNRVFQRESPRWLSAIFGGAFLFALTVFVLMFLNRNPDPNAFPPYPNAADLIQTNIIVFIVTTIVGFALGYFVINRAGFAGISGLLTGVIAAIISAPMAAIVFNGVTGAGTDILVAAFRSSGNGILGSALAQGVVSDPFDKMTSFLLVWIIIQSLPRRLLARFPNSTPK